MLCRGDQDASEAIRLKDSEILQYIVAVQRARFPTHEHRIDKIKKQPLV